MYYCKMNKWEVETRRKEEAIVILVKYILEGVLIWFFNKYTKDVLVLNKVL